jgi:hypothetical protein
MRPKDLPRRGIAVPPRRGGEKLTVASSIGYPGDNPPRIELPDLPYFRVMRSPTLTRARAGQPLRQLIQQRPRVVQVKCIETLGEPIEDRTEQVTRFPALPLVAPETGEAGAGA